MADLKMPITMQPVVRNFNCSNTYAPPGLDNLHSVDRLMIQQQVELIEAFTSFETSNKYRILNSLGQDIYHALEVTGTCTRICCGPGRPFEIEVVDPTKEVIHIHRYLRCSLCCFPCCLQKLEVFSPPGSLIGSIKQVWSCCKPRFHICNAHGKTVLQIVGPICTANLCGSVEFQVNSKDGSTNIGKISKHWSGLVKEYFTDADNFGVSFPIDLDVRFKAILLAAVFLIDFMYFEKPH